ncbi:tetratricopeptide repeat protein [Novosphingobium sp. PhB165]|uniref:tetratricopeptide repeat protein n=1 Tax=Novosphingobium sp. PhB165 TaxID=2485105 RepID=UPI00105193AB|nr:tetratricopeptide repeat protein [Novosphingobium sp. PhB165]TCM17127.1 tetratricopeptide repeat protein [Novosphingobium sp. PhB165]
MTKLGRSAFVLALLGGTALLAAGAQARDIGETVAKTLPRLQSTMNGNDCNGALKLVSPILARKDFTTLEPKQQAPVLLAATLCEGDTNKLEPALVHARMLTALPGAPDVAWRIRYGVEIDTGRNEDAVTTLEAVMKKPSAAATFENEWIFALARKLAATPDDPAYGRLTALVSADDFAPAQYEFGFDGMRLAHARQLAKDGKPDQAKAMLGKLRLGSAMRDASLDPVLRGLLPADFKLSDAYRHEVSVLEKMSLERPGLLALPIDLAATQRALGQGDKALATLEAARPDGALAKQFSDRKDRINWWWDGMARTYEQLGRYDKAVEAYQAAIALGEYGKPNFSQTINLAYLHIRFGHQQDAMTVLAPFADQPVAIASPYGMMEFHLAHGCAAQALGQTDAANADLAYAVAHAKDHPEAFTDLQLCLGRIDTAAAAMIARLNDPTLRIDALAQLSDYRALPAGVPPGPFDAGMQVLRGRADVQAAIARAGGTRHFDIYPSSL